MTLTGLNSVRCSVYGFGLPSKPHNTTILQSGFTDVANSISDLPMEVKHMILEHLGASTTQIKKLVSDTLFNFDKLEDDYSILMDKQNFIEEYEALVDEGGGDRPRLNIKGLT